MNVEISVDEIARVCHEVNAAYCRSIGDSSQLPWDEAPDWQKESAKNGVAFHLNDVDSTPEDSHNSWLAEKKEQGWIFGEVKDPDKKTHPCMLPYAQLPQAQRSKDYIFLGIVRALSD